jgi:hypothetical protein
LPLSSSQPRCDARRRQRDQRRMNAGNRLPESERMEPSTTVFQFLQKNWCAAVSGLLQTPISNHHTVFFSKSVSIFDCVFITSELQSTQPIPQNSFAVKS